MDSARDLTPFLISDQYEKLSEINPPLINHNKQKSQSCFSQQRGQPDSAHVFSCKSRHRAMKSKGLMQKNSFADV